LKSGRRVQCKCHGVSGSCAVRTCWLAMPEIRHVGDKLSQLYRSAEPVHVRRGASRDRIVVSGSALPASSESLVYSRPSPDYCYPRPALGLNGTSGRACANPTVCRRVCCGRGYVVRTRTFVDKKCRCKFHYCCYVTCQSCVRTVEQFVCL